ncbi:MAG: phosphoglycerate dehydrogenase [Chloroflexi bacterium]|nr:phosphoglycerate dehydrogenase [Chloroflexota bacterium]
MTDLKQFRVLVTATSYGLDDPSLRRELEQTVGEVIYNPAGHPLTGSELAAMVPGIDGMIAGLDEINGEVIAAADRLRIIARYGVGLDRVDLEAARRKGIVVTNTPGANAVSVAELSVGLMIALARHLIEANAQTRNGAWPRFKGVTLHGKTVGLLGLGAIGRHTAQILRGFGSRIVGYDPNVTPEQANTFGVLWMDRDQVIREADFLSLHLPVLPETARMLDRALIGTMKPGAYLINTARSELIDDDALIEALQSGHLAGAALDTFHREPPDPSDPLLALKQVIVTPHTGAHSDDATRAMGRIALEECLAVLRGGEPQFRVV